MPAVIFTGQAIKALKDRLNFFTAASIESGTVDPSSSATAADKGSLYLNTSSGLVYRKTDNGSSTNWALINAGSGIDVYRDVTTTDSPSTSDQTLNLSGASFTVTLPSAAGITGKTFTFIHSGTSLSQVYTIDGNGSETIGGLTTYLLYTNKERLTIVSDGTNWVVKSHETITPWVSYSMVITGRTSDPTRPTTVDYEMARWRRVGSSLELEFDYYAASLTGSAAGTGVYDYSLPSGASADTAQKNVNTNSNTGSGVGVASWYSSSQNRNFDGICTISNATKIAVNAGADGFTAADQSDAFGPLNDTTAIRIKASIPIDGWNA